jgi:hypothetical protein
MIQAKIKEIGDGQLKQIDEALKEQSGNYLHSSL